MKLKIILTIILLPVLLFGQDENNGQGIELPDFVITGVQKVSIPTAAKPKPKLVSTLSKEFITPQFSPEMFALSNISNPVLPELKKKKQTESIIGQLKLGAGFYTLPKGELNIGKGFKNVSLYGSVFGMNEREYIDNAGYNVSGGSFNSDFYISSKSKFLPGLNIFVNVNYLRDSYKFFGSDSSDLERETQNSSITFGIKNTYNNTIKYGVSVTGNFLDFSENDLGESRLSSDAFLDLIVSGVGVHSDAKFINQSLTNSSFTNEDFTYFMTDSRAVIKLNNLLQLRAGVNFAVYDGNSFFAPVASVSLKMNKSLTLLGEYAPGTNYHGLADFKNQNRYAVFDSTSSIVEKEKHKLKAAVRYQYLKYVEISAGASFTAYDNFVYYQDLQRQGFINVLNRDDVDRLSLFGNVMFHLGPAGYFYGDLTWQNVEDSENKQLPYNPDFITSLIYGYNFENGLTLKSKIDYKSSSYADLNNENEVPAYFNLALMFEYKLTGNLRLTLDLNNLIDRKNFNWAGYRENKVDFIAGVDYRW